MYRIWKSLLPMMVAKNNYLSFDDVEQLAEIKLGQPVVLGPNDRMSNYELNGEYALAANVHGDPVMNGKASLSLRIELSQEPQPNNPTLTWRRYQGRVGGRGSSVLDLSCISEGWPLSLKEAESDLGSIGFKPYGTLRNIEVFRNNFMEIVYVYYETPVEVTPDVTSIHIVGFDGKKRSKPPVP